MLERKNEKRYIFWVGSYRYSGKILSETESHWLVLDPKAGEIDIPKTAVRKEVEE